MKLQELHEAWDWRKTGKGAAIAAALGGGALFDVKSTPDQQESKPSQEIQAEPVKASEPTPPSTQPTTQQSKSDMGAKLVRLYQRRDPKAVQFGDEYPTIVHAAERNGCQGDDFYILLAIRKSENGRAGREFGILHPKAKDTNLDTQAGWCAATIVKTRKQWVDAGQPGDFISFLGKKYCPVGAENDPTGLNQHWIKNVSHHYRQLKAIDQ